MPTTYTHDIFGKEVYKRLPSEIKEAIRESKSMYLTGLHGSDILFYYQPLVKNRVSGLGHQVHKREAAEFFCQAVVKYQEEPTAQMLSYLLGFGCHCLAGSPTTARSPSPICRPVTTPWLSLRRKVTAPWYR